MMLAHLRKGETYQDLAVGFGVGTTTAYRYLREAVAVLAALAPTLTEAIQAADSSHPSAPACAAVQAASRREWTASSRG